MKAELNQLMKTYLEEFMQYKQPILNLNWTDINRELLANQDNIYKRYFSEFYELFSKLSDETIHKLFKKFKTTPPTILFQDVTKFYKKYSKINIKVSSTTDEKVLFLVYTFVVEVYVADYINRMNSHVLDI